MKFSKKEINDLIKSLLVVAFVFTFANMGLSFSLSFLWVLLVSVFTVGTGFVLHELAHKYFAQKYGCWSEFRSDDKLLTISLFISLLGVVFIAPGAVFIQGNISRKKYGIISLAGPLTNILLGVVFLILYLVSVFHSAILSMVFSFGFRINILLALFNMIPFAMFDGKKILMWSKKAFCCTIVAAVFLQAISIVIL